MQKVKETSTVKRVGGIYDPITLLVIDYAFLKIDYINIFRNVIMLIDYQFISKKFAQNVWF